MVNLEKLRQLNCEGTKVTDAGMKYVAQMPQLWLLRLSSTQIGDKGLQNLLPLKKLEFLVLDGTKVTNDGIKVITKFPILETLNLSKTNVDDGGIDTLAKLKSVDMLYLEGTKMTDKGIEKLRSELKFRCKIFEHDATFDPGL